MKYVEKNVFHIIEYYGRKQVNATLTSIEERKNGSREVNQTEPKLEGKENSITLVDAVGSKQPLPIENLIFGIEIHILHFF